MSVIWVPRPGWLLAVSRPPCALASSSATVRPMPLPDRCEAWCPRQNRSKTRGNSCAGIPVPVSLTVRTASRSEGSVEIVTVPPAGVNLRAFVSRFVITWCSQRGSPSMSAAASCRSTAIPAASNRPGQAVSRGAGDGAEVSPSNRQVQSGRIGGSQCLQVVNHLRQSQHLVAQRRQLFGSSLGNPVDQGLMSRLEDRDGGAQLVRNVGDQVAAKLLLPVHGVGHLVERDAELGQRRRGGHIADPGGSLATRHSPGHVDNPLHSAGRSAGRPQGRPGMPATLPARRRGDGPEQVRS